MIRPSCLYCGQALPAELVAEAEARQAEAARGPDPAAPAGDAGPEPAGGRLLLLLDLSGADAAVLARALGLSAYDAGQRLRRGGWQLHRAAAPAEAEAEAARLRELGLRVTTVAERLARVEPLLVAAGRLEPGRLVGRSPEGPELQWSREDLLLVVKGPIRRELQAQPKELKRVKTAGPGEGYRFHLHPVAGERPLELDPDAFELEGGRGIGSSLLRMAAWIEALAPPVPVDDGFRLLPPALGPGQPSPDAARALGRAAEPKPAAVVLDNLRQFRFYSGWRGAIARRG